MRRMKCTLFWLFMAFGCSLLTAYVVRPWLSDQPLPISTHIPAGMLRKPQYMLTVGKPLPEYTRCPEDDRPTRLVFMLTTMQGANRVGYAAEVIFSGQFGYYAYRGSLAFDPWPHYWQKFIP